MLASRLPGLTETIPQCRSSQTPAPQTPQWILWKEQHTALKASVLYHPKGNFIDE